YLRDDLTEIGICIVQETLDYAVQRDQRRGARHGGRQVSWQRHRRTVVVAAAHQRRPVDFRTGWRLGADDHIVVWKRPPRPEWMSQTDYNQLAEELAIRQVRVRVPQRGFRVREVIVATTLLDPDEAPARQVAQLFRARWHAELHLRSLKVVLGMDVLRCK